MILCLPDRVKRNSNLFRALPHFVALLLSAGAAFGQVYRWVDEKGVTHYGAQPPQGAKAREVDDKLATPPGAAAPPREDWQQKEREFRQRQIQSGEAEAKKAQEGERRRAVCNEQRDRLARLRQAPRTYQLDEKGERVFLDDRQRDDAIARQEKTVAQYCQD
jgi:uncharacterized protein DUF4124